MRWRLPAYQLDQLVRADGASQLWRGRARSDNTPVLIRRLAGCAAALGAVQLRVDRVRQLGEPHLQVGQVLARGEDLVVVDPITDGGTLADLLTRRGRISQGETVTVLAPLASALDAAHRAGLIHGSISAADINFSATGRPALTGLIVAAGRLDFGSLDHLRRHDVVPPRAAGPVTDLRALAAVAIECLTGGPAPTGPSGQVTPEVSAALTAEAPQLARVLIPALSAWSGSTEQLAAMLVGAVQPEPVQLRMPTAAAARDAQTESRLPGRQPPGELMVTREGRRPAPRHRNPGRPSGLGQRLGIAAAALALVAVFAWAGVRWAASDESATGSPASILSPVPPSSGSVATPTAKLPGGATTSPGRLATVADVHDPAEWKTYLSGLYTLRAGALMDADVAALGQVFLPNSAAYEQAADQISALVATQTSISDFRPTVLAVSQVLIGKNEAQLTVLDNVPAYTVRSKGGSTTKPGRGQAKVLLVLRPSEGRWLIATATIARSG